ncbi:hypothetical protein [Parasitella parasitica]|uniref:Uncharacterized protein n=1 Tax=Parasitella parasitica TaxID=35722 RepID=A0A0B7N1B6_9FUNG|nr:hypothetical protein [Parasitella parasitica]
MRFSTTNPVSMTHSNSTSTFKKVISTLISKLPHQQANINTIKIHPMPAPAHSQKCSSAITKQDDIYRNLRDYYTTQNSRKRQHEEPLVLTGKDTEREIRHKTVKQYQQTKDNKKLHQHWKEYSYPSSNIVNKSAPPKYKTHGYVRDTRSNSNHLRITAITNSCSSRNVIINKEKHFIPKRKDEFQWGSKSKLSNAL